MLLRFAMFCLICALVAGVFGFEDTLPTLPQTTAWGRYLFPPLVLVAVAAMTAGTWHRSESTLVRSQDEPNLETGLNHESRAGDTCLPNLSMAGGASFPLSNESTSHVKLNSRDYSSER